MSKPDWLKPWSRTSPTQTEDYPRVICPECGKEDVAVTRVYHNLHNKTTLYLRCKREHDFEIAFEDGVVYDLVFWR